MMIIRSGYLDGNEFNFEGTMEEVFGEAVLNALPGNPAALFAIYKGGYSDHDAPFYYGRINRLGYIVSHRDLYG